MSAPTSNRSAASGTSGGPARSRGCHTGATHRTDQSPLHRHPAQISPPGNREGRLNLPVDRSARGPSAPKTQSDVCRQTTDGSMDSTRNPLDEIGAPATTTESTRLLRDSLVLSGKPDCFQSQDTRRVRVRGSSIWTQNGPCLNLGTSRSITRPAGSRARIRSTGNRQYGAQSHCDAWASRRDPAHPRQEQGSRQGKRAHRSRGPSRRRIAVCAGLSPPSSWACSP